MADQSALAAALHTACLLEVTARKPGNVHPLASFRDCDWRTFAESAEAIAPVLSQAAVRPLGESILEAVQATHESVGRNTNLGMILLLASLAAVPHGGELRRGVQEVLNATTKDDCRRVYEAIRLANPGGIGKADREDVSNAPSVTLLEAMRLAADRDDIAKQYVTGFDDVFCLSERFDAGDLPGLERQIIGAHVERIAATSDSLIRRKCGGDIADEAARRADAVVAAGLWEADATGEPTMSPSQHLTATGSRSDGLKARPTGIDELEEFDGWLRADGNRRNPGTTADLIAAALFVAIRRRRVRCFEEAEILEFGRRMQAGS